jgi:hypothetical protein
LNGVAQKAQEYLPETGRIAKKERRDLSRNLAMKLQPLFHNLVANEINDGIDADHELERLVLQFDPVRLDLRKVEGAVDCREKLFAGVSDLLDVSSLRRVELGIEEKAREPDQVAHGWADVAAHQRE